MKNPIQKYCTFYVVRHGETDWNGEKRWQGQTDIPLNEKGIKQAHALSSVLSTIHFDYAFSSDLVRAYRTAKIIVQEKKIAVLTTKLLRERCFAEYEGNTMKSLNAELRTRIKKLWKMSPQEMYTHKVTPNYETDENIVSRFITFVREISVAYPEKTILVTSHGSLMRTFLIHVGKVKRILDHRGIKNGGYFILKSDGIDFFIEKVIGVQTR